MFKIKGKQLFVTAMHMAILGSVSVQAQSSFLNNSGEALSKLLADRIACPIMNDGSNALNSSEIDTNLIETLMNDFIQQCSQSLSFADDLVANSDLDMNSSNHSELMIRIEREFLNRYEARSGHAASDEIRAFAQTLGKSIADIRNHARRMHYRGYQCSANDSTVTAIASRLNAPLAALKSSKLAQQVNQYESCDESIVWSPVNYDSNGNLTLSSLDSTGAVVSNRVESRPVISTSPSKFRYAGKGSATKLRMHPSQVDGLKSVRKVNSIKIKGLGYSLGGREVVFRNNVNMFTKNYHQRSGLTGAGLIKAMESYTKENGCIPKLLIAGHGYGSPLVDPSKRESIATTSSRRDAGLGFYRSGRNVTIEGTLKAKVDSGAIKFCGGCEVFLHACSISPDFAKSLAKVSGCNVVAANHKVSPVSPTYTKARTNRKSYANNGEYEQVWFTSGSGNFFEYLPSGDSKVIGKTFVMDPDHIQKNNLILE